MSKKLLFGIYYDLETGAKDLQECDYHSDLDWSNDEYDVELLNSLAVSLGAKIGTMYKSDKVRQQALNAVTKLIQSSCNNI